MEKTYKQLESENRELNQRIHILATQLDLKNVEITDLKRRDKNQTTMLLEYSKEVIELKAANVILTSVDAGACKFYKWGFIITWAVIIIVGGCFSIGG